MLGLINQVLDMAKFESGRTVLETSPADLPLLIQDVDLMMRARFEAAGLQFVVEVADDVPRYVICDGQFEPFVQLQGAAAPGTGLGLSIVREFRCSWAGRRSCSSSGWTGECR